MSGADVVVRVEAMAMMRAMLACLIVVLLLGVGAAVGEKAGVYMADGIKIGEVRQDSAIIWTRLTRNPERNIKGFAFNEERTSVPAGRTLDDMEGGVPGTEGEVRAIWWPQGEEVYTRETNWMAVDPRADFTRQFVLSGLAAGTQYELEVQGRVAGAVEASYSLSGGFRTPSETNDPAKVTFVVVTCQEYLRRDDPENGHRIYSLMLDMHPDFFVHTGDMEYYDRPHPFARTVELARFKWNRVYAMPFQREFHRRVSSYFMKDDHDTLKNDCWPGQRYGKLTWEQGLTIFREQVPMGDRSYRTFRWGKDLQIWLVEGREFRSPNNRPDWPGKTIWGAEQKRWFYDSVEQSDATFRVLISPTPIVGPDRDFATDNYASKGFSYEGGEIRRFIGSQKNMYVVCGDRHWQYASKDASTGVHEFGTGPSSDQHAEGFSLSMRQPAHRFLRIKGGFLAVTVDRAVGGPTITFRHYGTDGKVYHEERLPTEASGN
jgi:alkaline phosphatase D